MCNLKCCTCRLSSVQQNWVWELENWFGHYCTYPCMVFLFSLPFSSHTLSLLFSWSSGYMGTTSDYRTSGLHSLVRFKLLNKIICYILSFQENYFIVFIEVILYWNLMSETCSDVTLSRQLSVFRLKISWKLKINFIVKFLGKINISSKTARPWVPHKLVHIKYLDILLTFINF